MLKDEFCTLEGLGCVILRGALYRLAFTRVRGMAEVIEYP